MRNLPPLTELRAFEAAARHLSFKLAAEELGVTPTAVSHQIRLLERYCGQLLFRRRPRPLALTSAGEKLAPVIHDGLETFANALSSVRAGASSGTLRITATNAFAARWLVPRLPRWRALYPHLKLDVIGTDAVLDLDVGEADVAIRYAIKRPTHGVTTELFRDRFVVVASPRLLGSKKLPLTPRALAALPLIEAEWPRTDTHAPSWQKWQRAARRRHTSVPDVSAILTFREELHAIQAAVAGQGVAICSSVLIAHELANGALVCVSNVTLPGYGFYSVHPSSQPNLALIMAFLRWVEAETVASQSLVP